ncbi:MAG TPA: hypothetical protein VGL06_09850 [Pseudonocardiaceae bacterium]|jgi:hypothetical protein
MPDSFSVDLGRLNNVAKTDLPNIIDAVNGTRTQLNSAVSECASAFDGTLYQAVGMMAIPVGNSFGYANYTEALLDDLVTGLGKLSDNLAKSKQAIHEIANRYAAADGQPPFPSV